MTNCFYVNVLLNILCYIYQNEAQHTDVYIQNGYFIDIKEVIIFLFKVSQKRMRNAITVL